MIPGDGRRGKGKRIADDEKRKIQKLGFEENKET